MTLMDELNEAIKKNLPQHVGEVLQKRLAEADRLEKAFLELERQVERLKANDRILQARISSERAVEEKSKQVDAAVTALVQREAACKLREGLIDLRETHAKERVAEMRGLVADVFANSRYKYMVQENGQVPVANGPNFPVTLPVTKTAVVSGEG